MASASDSPRRGLPLPRLGLRTWLVISHLLVLVIPVAFVILSGILRHELLRQAGDELRNRAPLVSRLITRELVEARARDPEAGLADVVPTLTPWLAHADDEPHPVGVWVHDAQGKLLDTTSAERPPSPRDLDRTLRGEVVVRFDSAREPGPWDRAVSLLQPAGRVVISAPIRVGHATVGAVVLSRSPHQPAHLLGVYKVTLRIIVALAVWVVVTVTLLMSDRLSTSLAHLAGTTRRLATGDLDAAETVGRPSRSAVAEVKELADDVTRMASRLDARLAFVEEFSSNLAHELRTPLSTLVATVELLQDDADMSAEDRTRFLARADEQLGRVRTVLDGLLALARAGASEARTPVDWSHLVREAAAAFAVPAAGEGETVNGDATALRLVVDNLLQNARQHGREPVRLTMWTSPSETGIEVTDAGPGIAPDLQHQVFERFFTTDRERGVGIGLALVRTIIQAHGGQVEVDGTPGATTFRVVLPRA